MQQALFLDPALAEPTPIEDAPRRRPASAGVLLVNPEILDVDRVRVEALLRSLARLKESDIALLQKAVAKLTEDDDRTAWEAIDAALEADNQALRDRFVAGGGALTLADLAGRSGRGIDEAHALVERWEAGREIMSARHRGTTYFPAFQFRNGRPHPTVRQALAALPADITPWQRVFWFVSANGWLSGAAPEDRLDDPNLIVEVARHESEILVG